MRGLDYYLRHTRQDNAQARKFVKEAIKIDKEYAFAYVILGFIHLYDLFYGSGLFLQNAREFGKCAFKAFELNDSFDLAHVLLGYYYLLQNQHDKTIAEMNKAVLLILMELTPMHTWLFP